MAKRGRPHIHPPKTPKCEEPQVTIANQGRQIKVLIDRVEYLDRELKRVNAQRDENFNNGNLWRTKAEAAERALLRLRTENLDLVKINEYSNGYIARVKECDGRGIGHAVD